MRPLLVMPPKKARRARATESKKAGDADGAPQPKRAGHAAAATSWGELHALVLFESVSGAASSPADLPVLLACAKVCKLWRSQALQCVRSLHFCPHQDRVKAADVLSVLKLTGDRLRLVDLGGCVKIDAKNGMQEIMRLIRESFPSVMEVDISGCESTAILQAIAVLASVILTDSQPGHDRVVFDFEQIRTFVSGSMPRLVLHPGFVP